MAFRALMLAAVLALGLAAPGLADDAPTLEQCEARFDTCMSACQAANPDSSAGLAGCQARCAAERAGCEAKAGYEQAKPWVQEQFERMEDFFEGFRKGPGDEPPPPAKEAPADVGPKDI